MSRAKENKIQRSNCLDSGSKSICTSLDGGTTLVKQQITLKTHALFLQPEPEDLVTGAG